jgi:hypothetical protein
VNSAGQVGRRWLFDLMQTVAARQGRTGDGPLGHEIDDFDLRYPL